MISKSIKNIFPGIVFAILIAIPAWFLGKKFPVIGGPVFAIIFGLILGSFYKNERLEPGIAFTSKKVLQYSIVLLGFDMNLYNIIQVGRDSLLIILVTISIALLTAYIFSKMLSIPPKTAILIGVGSSICGGSAIAATAPSINAESEDVARAISTIFFFNVIAALIFPTLGRILNLSDQGFGLWAGTAVNDTSSVVASATSWSAMSGNNSALRIATIVKLTRTLAIIPITLTLAIYTSKKNKSKSGENLVSIRKIFPWFILFFLLAAILNTIFTIPEHITKTLVSTGKFMITMAMASIGFNTNIHSLFNKGARPLLLGFICWIAIAVSSLIVQSFIGIW